MSPFEAAPEAIDFDLLATYLKALANAGRLELLFHLRAPASAAEVEVRPRRKDDLPPDRAMSRQTILAHLEKLQESGIVTRVPAPEGGADRWVTNVPQVFAVVEELRKLTAIPPSAVLDAEETTAGPASHVSAWVDGQKLVLLTGPWEGRIYRLEGAGPWSIGRSRQRTIALTYDPFVSSDHAHLEYAKDGAVLHVGGETRNPTSVNLVPVPAGTTRAMRHGDILTVGRSTLVYHAR